MPDIVWMRSTSCTTGNCVEVAKVGGEYWIRDSKNPDVKPLRFDQSEWTAFVKGAEAGEFNFR